MNLLLTALNLALPTSVRLDWSHMKTLWKPGWASQWQRQKNRLSLSWNAAKLYTYEVSAKQGEKLDYIVRDDGLALLRFFDTSGDLTLKYPQFEVGVTMLGLSSTLYGLAYPPLISRHGYNRNALCPHSRAVA